MYVQKSIITSIRIALGWVMFYAGITKVLDPSWSAKGFLMNAETFPALFEWFASPGVLPVVNQLNQWGLTLIGVSLLLGLFTRPAAWAGVVLMILYWLPALNFPYVGEHAYLIDEHIIYALVFAFLALVNAGRAYGLDILLARYRTDS